MKDAQEIWEVLLKDNWLRCTCAEELREDKILQAKGHYHHCMLWQVAQAVEVSLKYCCLIVKSSEGGNK